MKKTNQTQTTQRERDLINWSRDLIKSINYGLDKAEKYGTQYETGYLHEKVTSLHNLIISMDNLNQREQTDFMESHEDNDEITPFIKSIIGDKYDIIVEYHEVSDGKHKVFINGVEFRINGWTERTTLKEELQDREEEIKRGF